MACGKPWRDAGPKSVANRNVRCVEDVPNQGRSSERGPKVKTGQYCLTENLFCNGAEKQLGYAVSSVCADDEEIRALLSDDLSQFRPQFTLPNDEFVLNASKSPGLNQRVLQIRGSRAILPLHRRQLHQDLP